VFSRRAAGTDVSVSHPTTRGGGGGGPRAAPGEHYMTRSFTICKYLPGIIRITKSNRMKTEVQVASMTEMRKMHKILVGRSEEKTLHGRHRLRWNVMFA
jgi:hypothetical protein